MDEQLLIDTDILIDVLRGRTHAVGFMAGLIRAPCISVTTVAELYAGVRDGETHDLDTFLSAVTLVPVTEELARTGGLFRRDFGPSHGTGLIDGIIAATADALDIKLATLNRRHYPMLDDVVVPY